MARMNSVIHFEMPAKDRARAKKFYEEVFGWQMTQTGEDFGNYLLAVTTESDDKGPKNPGAINGGFFDYDEKIPGRTTPSVVISVDKINESMEMVKKSGGTIEGEPQNIPGIGLWVVFIDSEGNRVSMIQPPSK